MQGEAAMGTGFEGEGDFALYLWLGDTEEQDHVIRNQSAKALEIEGLRLLKGGRFKYASIYQWDYQTEGDSKLIMEL